MGLQVSVSWKPIVLVSVGLILAEGFVDIGQRAKGAR